MCVDDRGAFLMDAGAQSDVREGSRGAGLERGAKQEAVFLCARSPKACSKLLRDGLFSQLI